MKRRLIVGVQSLSAAVGRRLAETRTLVPIRSREGEPPGEPDPDPGLFRCRLGRSLALPGEGDRVNHATRCCGFCFLVALTYFAYAAAASFQGLTTWAAVAIIKAMAISSCRWYGQSQKSAADKRPVQSTVRMRNRSGRSRAVRVHQ